MLSTRNAKVYYQILCILISSLFIQKISATSTFIKYLENPLIIPHIGSWDAKFVANPIILKRSNFYHMWYSGSTGSKWQIGYASSPNGVNGWTFLNNPVIPIGSTDDWENETTDANVIFFPDTNEYKMWYSSVRLGWANGPDKFRLRFATSNDGINWVKTDQWLMLTTLNSWDSGGPHRGKTILYKNNLYHLWYAATNDNDLSTNPYWRIGYATSTDGINWTKQNGGNPVIEPTESWELKNVSFPTVIDDNGTYKMWYGVGSADVPTQVAYAYSTDGVSWTKPASDNPVFTTTPNSFDSMFITITSAMKDDDGVYKFWYSGTSGPNWKIGLATSPQISIVPTPSPTPNPTSTPAPTPTPTPITPIVIVPGFMASWNKDAILHNTAVSYNDWKLLRFVKDYDGLMETLKKLNYQEGSNLFLFAYDWRQTIDKTTQDLQDYLQEKIWDTSPAQKIYVVGHSLGGVIARIFAQNHKDAINKIISVGSPHQGAVQFYKPVEAGELDRANTIVWLAQKIFLILNKSAIESDRITIANKFPVAKDLFPTFNFLKDAQGNEILTDTLTAKNTYLASKNQTFSDIFPLFTAIYGEKDNQTPSGFIIQSANPYHQLLGNYTDGQPVTSLYDVGDYTSLSKSANQDADSIKLTFDHEEIITKKDAISKILETLNINFTESQIIEGEKTTISPSLIFMIRSPAVMTVEFDSNEYVEDEGIIIIPNAQSGNYTLHAHGTALGTYEITIGQISDTNDLWETINGEITSSPPSSQIDTYTINFNNQTALSITPTPTQTPTPTPTSTPTPTPTPTSVPSPTPTPTQTLASSSSSSSQSTNTPTTIQSLPIPQGKKILSINSSTQPNILGISKEKELICKDSQSNASTQGRVNQSAMKLYLFDYTLVPLITVLLLAIAWLFKNKLWIK